MRYEPLPTPFWPNLSSFAIAAQKLADFFESQFMIDTLTPYIKAIGGSVTDFGRPKGLLALSAAAVSKLHHIRRAHPDIAPRSNTHFSCIETASLETSGNSLVRKSRPW
jgi:hypothetical protein